MSTEQQIQTDRPRNIFDDAVCLLFEINSFGTSRNVRSESALATHTGADTAMVHISKDVLDSPELRAIRKADGEMRKWITLKSLPSPLKTGMYLVPNLLVPEVDAELIRFKESRAFLVSGIRAWYPSRMAEAERRRGNLYNASDYPPVENVIAAFDVRVQYLSFDVPRSLREIRQSIWQRETTAMAEQAQNVMAECAAVLRSEFADLVSHMSERLTSAPGEKKKVFRDSLIGNLSEFLSTFAARNLAGDVDLEEAVTQARRLLSGVDPSTLRDDEAMRAAVATGMNDLKSKLDALVTEAPSRRYDFGS